MSMRKVMKKIFVGTSKMILKVFLRRKILGGLLVEYLGSISGKNLRGSLGKYLGSISGKNLKGSLGKYL
jgi:F0F1-type ATP synthase delta subunit